MAKQDLIKEELQAERKSGLVNTIITGSLSVIFLTCAILLFIFGDQTAIVPGVACIGLSLALSVDYALKIKAYGIMMLHAPEIDHLLLELSDENLEFFEFQIGEFPEDPGY